MNPVGSLCGTDGSVHPLELWALTSTALACYRSAHCSHCAHCPAQQLCYSLEFVWDRCLTAPFRALGLHQDCVHLVQVGNVRHWSVILPVLKVARVHENKAANQPETVVTSRCWHASDVTAAYTTLLKIFQAGDENNDQYCHKWLEVRHNTVTLHVVAQSNSRTGSEVQNMTVGS